MVLHSLLWSCTHYCGYVHRHTGVCRGHEPCPQLCLPSLTTDKPCFYFNISVNIVNKKQIRYLHPCFRVPIKLLLKKLYVHGILYRYINHYTITKKSIGIRYSDINKNNCKLQVVGLNVRLWTCEDRKLICEAELSLYVWLWDNLVEVGGGNLSVNLPLCGTRYLVEI